MEPERVCFCLFGLFSIKSHSFQPLSELKHPDLYALLPWQKVTRIAQQKQPRTNPWVVGSSLVGKK